ncbi:MAG: hypothetical protein J1G01_03525 [Clostridiales bacterium]|nr:hypothetical protein [Clostridiales bacterium]
MKYFGQTFSYLKRNFLLPVIAMLVPSLVACFLSTPYWEVSFVAAFDYAPYISVAQTFRIMFGDSWQYLWPVVVIATVQVFGASLVMSAIDRHFRTGRLSLRDPLRLINNSIFPLAIGVIVMSVFSILWRFLLFGLVTLVQVATSAMSLPSGAALAIISAVAVGMFILHVMIITPMLFWAPIMFVYGYGFRDAAATSFKMLAGKRVFIELFLPMVVCVGVQLLVGFLHAHTAVAVIINFFVFLVTNVYAIVYTMMVFNEISGLDRRDVKPYHNAPLPPPIRKTEADADRQQKSPQKHQQTRKSSQKHEKNSIAATDEALKVNQTDSDVATTDTAVNAKTQEKTEKTAATKQRTRKSSDKGEENGV